MKKFFIITLAVIVSIAFIFYFDYLFFRHMYRQSLGIAKSVEKYIQDECLYPSYFVKLKHFDDVYEIMKQKFRPIMNPNSTKDSILIFGCSYAYGYVFDNKETISYVLSKYSKRPIINRAYMGWGISHMLYQLRNDAELKNYNPKYIIYVVMDGSGHFERLCYTNFSDLYAEEYYYTYKLKNGELVENKPLFNLYYNLSLFRHIHNKFINKNVYNKFEKNDEKLFDLFVKHFKTINAEIKKIWKDKDGNSPEFIILTFEGTKSEIWQEELEKEGIKVIDISKTIGIENINELEKGFFEPEIASHPNGKLWKELVPKLKEMYPDL